MASSAAATLLPLALSSASSEGGGRKLLRLQNPFSRMPRVGNLLPLPRRSRIGIRTTIVTRLRFSRESNGKPQEEEDGEQEGERVLFDSDDASYLWKMAAGSIGGASAIKYGSILYPEMTRPSIVQALLMVSLPVLVATLILIKESMSEPEDFR